jgi:hypothetical protein
MAKTARERDHEARQGKLEHMREQISSGHLVIRAMTKAERAKWAKRRGVVEANWTPTERANQEAALRNRRRRAERHA